MTKKVVITGCGAVTPIGIGVSAMWENLCDGMCGIAEITKTDTAALQVHKAGEIKDLNPKNFLSTKLSLDLEPFMQYAYIAAEEALKQSGLETNSDRIGVIMGSALSGITVISETSTAYAVNNKAAGPKYLTKAMGNIAAAQLGIQYGLRGPSMTVTTACSSGGDAITLASMFIESGQADAMVVMAGEAAVCPTLIQSLCKTGALSKSGDSKPFDTDRSGFVLGEGGGALIIEREDHAKKRGAAILAELTACANNADAFNPVSPEPEGKGASACMQLALTKAGLSPDDIGYINAHGTATHAGDIAETKAIQRVFGLRPVYVSSTKGATGHMMGAGGIVEIITCIMAIRTGILPINTGMDNQDPECGLNIVNKANCNQKIEYAMSNSMGFGGQNSCVIVGRYKENT